MGKLEQKITFASVLLLFAFSKPLFSAAPPEGKDPGARIMNFVLENQNGKMTKLSSLISGKKSVVYFFMGCCTHCVGELKKLSELNAKLEARGVQMVGVQYYGNNQMCKANVERFHFPGSILGDAKAEVCGKLGVGEFTVITVDSKGVILYRGTNYDRQAIEKSLELSKK